MFKSPLTSLLGFLLLLTVSAVPANDHAGDDHARLSLPNPGAVDALIDGFVTDGAYPFVYARLEDRDGQVIYEHGAVNRELMPYAVDGDSWIRIWSMSKIVTIAVAMDLVEEGKLSLDDPVTRYLPEFGELKVAVAADGADLSTLEDKSTACPLKTVPRERDMTVRDLLNHKAGFYYPVTGIECLDRMAGATNLPTAVDSQELIDRMAKLPLITQPGGRYYYGTATTVLGLVLERATDQSLKQLVEERVTGPLEIDGLRYGLPEGERLPPRFSGRDGTVREATAGELDIFGSALPEYGPERTLYLGGEGMVATADGYADFARMLLRRGALNGHRFLEATTVDEIATPRTMLDSPWGRNGYNLWLSNGKFQDGSQGPPLWIGGGYEGTHFWIDPQHEFVGVIVSQILWVPKAGANRDERIRREIYEQLGAVKNLAATAP